MSRIRCAVVDDESLSRDLLRRFIADDPDLELAGEAATASEALGLIAAAKPDLLFLDVQMPEMSGFDLLDAMPLEEIPLTIFVTAYDSYALRAFEVHALDYLLKPFDRQRFRSAIDTAVARIQTERRVRYAEKLEKALAERSGRRIVVRSGGRLVPIRSADIDWVEAEGNYVRIHTAAGDHVIRTTLREFAESLPSSLFLRIHRSAVVNVNRVTEVQPWHTGEYIVKLAGGRELTLSRTYRDEFLQALGHRD